MSTTKYGHHIIIVHVRLVTATTIITIISYILRDDLSYTQTPSLTYTDTLIRIFFEFTYKAGHMYYVE